MIYREFPPTSELSIMTSITLMGAMVDIALGTLSFPPGGLKSGYECHHRDDIEALAKGVTL